MEVRGKSPCLFLYLCHHDERSARTEGGLSVGLPAATSFDSTKTISWHCACETSRRQTPALRYMEQAADKLALVEKLIQCIAQESDKGIENEKNVTALMEYAIRILSSRLTPPPLATDEYHISQLLQKKSK